MALLLLKVSAVFYALVAVFGLVQLKWPREFGDRVVLVGLSLAVVAHALALGGRTVEVGTFPLLDLHDGLSLFGFLTAVIAIGIAWRSGVPQAAPLASVLVTVLVVAAAMVDASGSVPERLRSPWLPVHIATAFLGEAAFAIAGIVASIYLLQERRLKSKHKIGKMGTGLHRLPALEILDNVSARLIQIGFPVMTIGLFAGAIFSNEVTGHYFTWGLLNTVSVLVWALYALMLHFRLTIGWRGKKAAVLTLIGVICTLVALVGLGLAGVGAHGTGGVS
ncbi:MAG: cytochrome c biogenesis protein CcsA [Deltaproteobacteria bacterium]|jgi:cytochrome c-type biogenesis protein CcsB|nr:cytochrome c biogenesis protein CcsA [Deltaproteobacteria bacterium]